VIMCICMTHKVAGGAVTGYPASLLLGSSGLNEISGSLGAGTHGSRGTHRLTYRFFPGWASKSPAAVELHLRPHEIVLFVHVSVCQQVKMGLSGR
jgi:hypothetical protein